MPQDIRVSALFKDAVSSGVATMTKNVKGGFAEVKKSATDLGSSFGGLKSAIGGLLAIGTITKLFAIGVQGFDAAAVSSAELTHSLGFTSKALEDQAQALAKVTRFDDDATRAAQASLAARHLNEEEIRVLIPLVQDLATVNKTDLVSAAQLVGRALDGDAESLKKYGVKIGEAQGISERFQKVVIGLKDDIEGQARVVGGVGVGAWTRFANTFKNTLGNMVQFVGESRLATAIAEKLTQIVETPGPVVDKATAAKDAADAEKAKAAAELKERKRRNAELEAIAKEEDDKQTEKDREQGERDYQAFLVRDAKRAEAEVNALEKSLEANKRAAEEQVRIWDQAKAKEKAAASASAEAIVGFTVSMSSALAAGIGQGAEGYKTSLKAILTTTLGFLEAQLISAQVATIAKGILTVGASIGPDVALLAAGVVALEGAKGMVNSFAHGTQNAPEGMALVGESGPELVRLQRGDRVINNFETERVTNSPPIVINYHGGGANSSDRRAFTKMLESLERDGYLNRLGARFRQG